jgi:hypothetical protein
MRTKALLLTAALGAAGIATSMAQVYSVNAVGYINLSIVPGFNLVANQLVQPNTTISTLIPAPPQYTVFYKYSGGFIASTYDPDLGGWDPDPNLTFDVGGGAFIFNPTGSPFTVTLVGDVPQGALTNPYGIGYSMRSSKVPQSGAIQTVLNYTPTQYDQVLKFNPVSQGYEGYVFDPDLGGWDPAEPTLGVGEAIFLNAAAAGSWNRTFTVN